MSLFITGKEALKRIKSENIYVSINNTKFDRKRIYLEASSIEDIFSFGFAAEKYAKTLFTKFVVNVSDTIAKTAALCVENIDFQLPGVTSVNDLIFNGPFNISENVGMSLGVIATGEGYNIAKQIYGDNASYLKIGMVYPLSTDLLIDYANKHDQICVFDETGIIEKTLKELNVLYLGASEFGGIPFSVEKILTVINGEMPDFTEIADETPLRKREL